MLAIVGAALLAGMLGLIVSVRLNGPGPLLGTTAGRWLAERVVPSHIPAGMSAASEGDVIGPLALTDLDGHARPLPAPQGQRVLVNVWASWCGPCREEMPLLVGFAKTQGANGIAVVGIAQDDATSVRSYLRLTPANYPILLDNAQGDAGVRLGNRLGALPYSVLIDSNGRLLRRKYGPFADADALRVWISQSE
ncbi:MAG: TlpA disulfide reductase family protein [Lysobacteraceae bacterium]